MSRIREHAEAAARAVKAGFDGTEITSFMGYLLANFNSRFTNQRTDDYGGSIANRGRFMRELIGAIKQATPDNPLVVRLNGAELRARLERHYPLGALGVHAIGEQATELVHIGLVALQSAATAEVFIDTCFNYPTLTPAEDKISSSWNFVPAGHVMLVYGSPGDGADEFMQHHAWMYRDLIKAQLKE